MDEQNETLDDLRKSAESLEPQLPTAPGRPFTSKTAQVASLKRWEKAYDNAGAGMISAVNARLKEIIKDANIPLVKTPQQAWEFVIAHNVEILLRSTSLKGMADMTEKIGKATGMLHEASKNDTGTQEVAMAGLAEANVILQVVNFYNTDYKKALNGEEKVIDAEITNDVEQL